MKEFMNLFFYKNKIFFCFLFLSFLEFNLFFCADLNNQDSSFDYYDQSFLSTINDLWSKLLKYAEEYNADLKYDMDSDMSEIINNNKSRGTEEVIANVIKVFPGIFKKIQDGMVSGISFDADVFCVPGSVKNFSEVSRYIGLLEQQVSIFSAVLYKHKFKKTVFNLKKKETIKLLTALSAIFNEISGKFEEYCKEYKTRTALSVLPFYKKYSDRSFRKRAEQIMYVLGSFYSALQAKLTDLTCLDEDTINSSLENANKEIEMSIDIVVSAYSCLKYFFDNDFYYAVSGLKIEELKNESIYKIKKLAKKIKDNKMKADAFNGVSYGEYDIDHNSKIDDGMLKISAMVSLVEDISKKHKKYLIPFHKKTYQYVYSKFFDVSEAGKFEKFIKEFVFSSKRLFMAFLGITTYYYYKIYGKIPEKYIADVLAEIREGFTEKDGNFYKDFSGVFSKSEQPKNEKFIENASIDLLIKLNDEIASVLPYSVKKTDISEGFKSFLPNGNMYRKFVDSYSGKVGKDVAELYSNYVQKNCIEKFSVFLPEEIGVFENFMSSIGLATSITGMFGITLAGLGLIGNSVGESYQQIQNKFEKEQAIKNIVQTDGNSVAKQNANKNYAGSVLSMLSPHLHFMPRCVNSTFFTLSKNKSSFLGKEWFHPYFNSIMSFATSLIQFFAVSKVEDSTGILSSFSNAFKSFHDYMMNKEKGGFEGLGGRQKYSDYTLDSSVFDVQRKKGVLDPFISIINRIKDPLSSGCNSRIIMITGDSGSGKSFLTTAFAETIAKENKNGVNFIALDPRTLFEEQQKGENGQRGPDLMQQLKYLVNGAPASDRDNIYVVYLDEFHLFFADKSGRWDQNKIAEFLTLFVDIKEKQKNISTGVYLVLATNKPEFIPSEIFDNPSRVDCVVHLDVLDFAERIAFMEKLLKKYGIPASKIDFNYISMLLEGRRVSQGRIAQILYMAISKSQLKGNGLTTETVCESINDVLWQIVKDVRPITGSHGKVWSKYYSSSAFLGLILKENESIKFDTVTIYPIRAKIEPLYIDDMYKRIKSKKLAIGRIFYRYDSSYGNNISIKGCILDIFLALAGKVYAIKNKYPVPEDDTIIIEDFSTVYRTAVKCLMYFDPDVIIMPDEYKKFEEFGFVGEKLKEKIVNFIKICSKNLEIFMENFDYIEGLNSIAELLLEKKILKASDILSNDKTKKSFSNEKIQIQQKRFYEAIDKTEKEILQTFS